MGQPGDETITFHGFQQSMIGGTVGWCNAVDFGVVSNTGTPVAALVTCTA